MSLGENRIYLMLPVGVVIAYLVPNLVYDILKIVSFALYTVIFSK